MSLKITKTVQEVKDILGGETVYGLGLEEQSPDDLGYRVCEFIISQNGANPPTVENVLNTLDVLPIWTRLGAGDYRLVSADGLFTEGKTSVIATVNEFGSGGTVLFENGAIDVNNCGLMTYNVGVLTDNAFAGTITYNVKVYN